jgi:hypothetical protein
MATLAQIILFLDMLNFLKYFSQRQNVKENEESFEILRNFLIFKKWKFQN